MKNVVIEVELILGYVIEKIAEKDGFSNICPFVYSIILFVDCCNRKYNI